MPVVPHSAPLAGTSVFNPDPLRPVPGMSLEDAAAAIRKSWAAYKAAPDYDPTKPTTIQFDKKAALALFRSKARDCAWCVLHAHGDKALWKLHDLAVKGLNRGRKDRSGDELSGHLNHAFAFVGSWLG